VTTMMLRSLLLSLLAVLLISPTVALFDCLKCPTDDSLDPKCLINIIPPWLVSTFHFSHADLQMPREKASSHHSLLIITISLFSIGPFVCFMIQSTSSLRL
jgi:hypothetical protein